MVATSWSWREFQQGLQHLACLQLEHQEWMCVCSVTTNSRLYLHCPCEVRLSIWWVIWDIGKSIALAIILVSCWYWLQYPKWSTLGVGCKMCSWLGTVLHWLCRQGLGASQWGQSQSDYHWLHHWMWSLSIKYMLATNITKQRSICSLMANICSQ